MRIDTGGVQPEPISSSLLGQGLGSVGREKILRTFGFVGEMRTSVNRTALCKELPWWRHVLLKAAPSVCRIM